MDLISAIVEPDTEVWHHVASITCISTPPVPVFPPPSEPEKPPMAHALSTSFRTAQAHVTHRIPVERYAPALVGTTHQADGTEKM
jgi:hypothetical protein